MRPPASRSQSRSPAIVPPTTERRPSAPTPSGDRRPPLEPSIFMVEPIDEFTKEVADWLWGFCRGLDPAVVEIEAKIGILLDSRSRQRYSLPVPIETILTDASGLRFESNMTINQHKSYNLLLNSRVEASALPSYPNAPIRYAHTRETDAFHEIGGGKKVRVTKDAKGVVGAVVEKHRVADMNVFSPKRRFDWRVSVNVEVPAPLPNSPPSHTRYKDRISYSHQLFTLDLTQVTPSSGHAGPSNPATHELEIEFRDARVLLIEAEKEERGVENRYLEMVQCFLNNVRMLIRNAADP